MLAGSSAHAILDATLLQNAHFIRNWYFPLQVGPSGLLAATASVLAACAYYVSGSRPHMQDYRNLGVFGLKSGFVILGGIMLVLSPPKMFLTLVPFCWLLMVPPAGTQRQHTIARGVAGLIGAVMSLYPFPVGNYQQINIGALLPVVMVPILAYDVLTALHQREAVRRLPGWRYSFLAVTTVLVLGAAVTLRSAREYWHSVPLGLPGTSLIRAGQEQADDLRWVTAQLSSCTSSYSMPGMLSFTFWAGHSLPTALNINDVLAFISAAQQESIVQELSRQPDLCIVYNPEILQFFDRGQIQTNPPLLRYLHTDFAPTAERDGFVILKRRASVS